VAKGGSGKVGLSIPRGKALRNAVDALPPHQRPVISPAVPPPSPQQILVFKLVRDIAVGGDRLVGLRKAFPDLGRQVERVLDAHGKRATAFGSPNPRALADRMLGHVAGFDIQATTLAEFTRSTRGYRSNFNGEWFEWLVEGSPELRADVLTWARTEQLDLSRIAKGTAGALPEQLKSLPEKLVTAKDTPLILPPGKFGDPVVASDIRLELPDGSPKKFVDAMTVSLYLPKQPLPKAKSRFSHTGLTTLGQYKYRTAIRKAAKQTGEDPGRLSTAAWLVFTAEGVPHRFRPSEVVFASRSGSVSPNQYLVTHFADMAADIPKPGPVYSSDIDLVLKGGLPPQITPWIARGGDVRGILVELNAKPTLITDLTALILGP
jgi:hypothetical protein